MVPVTPPRQLKTVTGIAMRSRPVRGRIRRQVAARVPTVAPGLFLAGVVPARVLRALECPEPVVVAAGKPSRLGHIGDIDRC